MKTERSSMPEPKRTSSGKYKCPSDNKEYDTRADYDEHCREEHPGEM